MVTLNKRQKEIVSFLEQKSDWITIENISKVFDVSIRTIRNDLDSIENMLGEYSTKLQRKPKVGVRLEVKTGESIELILRENCNDIYSSIERAILISLILLVREHTTIEALSELLFVSKNTIANDLKIAEDNLKEVGISIVKKSYYGLTVKEINYEVISNGFIRLFTRLDENKTDIIYKELYEVSQCDNYKIRGIIELVEENKKIQFAEESLTELERALLFGLTKSKSINSKNLSVDDKYYKVLKDSIREMTFKDIDDEILSYLVKVFKGAKKSKYFNDSNESEIEKIVNEILIELCNLINIKIDDEEDFIKQMAMHLSVAIYRLKNNLIIENPMLEEIKYKMSFIYEVTEQILNKKKDIIGIEFPDSEIAYMTMYFETLFEKYVKGNLNSKVLIVCNGGLATSSLLKSRLNLMIPELSIEAICRLKDVDNTLSGLNVDLIISTVPLQLKNYKVIKVNPLLELNDLENIKSEIYNKWYEKKCQYLIDKVKGENTSDIVKIISQNNAQFNLKIDEWRVAIEIAAKPLILEKKIKKNYVNDMIKVVETLGNYMVFIPEIAFAHATPENVIDNGVSLLNLEKPIDFGAKNKVSVKTIVVLANKEESKNLINLVNILTKGDNISKFKNAASYEELKIIT